MSSLPKNKTLKSKMPKFGFLKRTPKKPVNSSGSSPKHKKDKENMNIVERKNVLSRESSKLSDSNNTHSKIPVFSAKMGKET